MTELSPKVCKRVPSKRDSYELVKVKEESNKTFCSLDRNVLLLSHSEAKLSSSIVTINVDDSIQKHVNTKGVRRETNNSMQEYDFCTRRN